MAHHEPTARPGHDRQSDSGYTEGERPMPAAGEDRMESIYRNPVGAQSNMPIEGQQQEGGTRSTGARALPGMLAKRLLRVRPSKDRRKAA